MRSLNDEKLSFVLKVIKNSMQTTKCANGTYVSFHENYYLFFCFHFIILELIGNLIFLFINVSKKKRNIIVKEIL